MNFEQLMADVSLYALGELSRWDRTLVVAPHPDDESLGCGGAIALLRQQQLPVHVLFISDGTMSHPHSQRYLAEARRMLREQEAKSALEILGVDASEITFLGLPDTQVPTAGRASARFREASALILEHLQKVSPRTLLVPWRRDPHGDHRATWQLLRAAVDLYDTPVRWLEYPVWVWESTNIEDLPTPTDGSWFKLNVGSVLDRKRRAIAAHVSQTTPLIDDDPDGFTLSTEMIGHFIQPYEYYLQP